MINIIMSVEEDSVIKFNKIGLLEAQALVMAIEDLFLFDADLNNAQLREIVNSLKEMQFKAFEVGSS